MSAPPQPSQHLAPTLAGLDIAPRGGLDFLRARGFRAVQLSAGQPGLRPRELGRSARRDLTATLRRLELVPAGVDCFIPPAHFTDAIHVDRAVDAVLGAIEFAADLGAPAVSLRLPDATTADVDIDGGGDGAGASTTPTAGAPAAIIEALAGAAQTHGVRIADHAVTASDRGPWFGRGIDPAAWLAAGADPVVAATSLGAALFAARFVDLDGAGHRVAPGGADGRLDVLAWRVALSMTPLSSVALDLRGWSDLVASLDRAMTVWDDGQA